MSVALDCSRSCLVTFPPAVYTTSGVDEIVPVLVRSLPEDVQCLQFLSQGRVRITFGCAESALSCFEDGVHFKGSSLPVQSADPRARLVYVRDCPSEVSDASVRELLAPYGVVRKVVQVPHNKFPKISSGTRRSHHVRHQGNSIHPSCGGFRLPGVVCWPALRVPHLPEAWPSGQTVP